MRFGVIGAGTMSRVHGEVLSKIAGAQVVAFGAPRIPDATRTLAAQLDAELLPSADALIGRSDIDAVIVAVPTDKHHEIAIAAAQAGKHIVCEKPLARTLEDGAALIEATERAGVKLAVGHVVRYFPEYAAARDLVISGQIGTPGIARTMRGAGFPQVPSNWYASLERSGGVVLDMMVHDFDWLRWTFGPIERLHARGLAYANRPGRDMAMAVLRFTSGAMGYVEGSWSYPSGFRTTLEISGSDGLLRTSSRGTTPLTYEMFPAADAQAGVALPAGGSEETPYLIQMRDFVRWFEGGSAPRCSPAEAFEALRIGLAALESVRTGKPAAFDKT